MKLLAKFRYKPNKEYWVHLRDIKILPQFESHRVGKEKWYKKLYFFRKYGKFESHIVLNYDFTLLDGYSSYRIAKVNNLGKVPVIFKKQEETNDLFR